MNPASHLLHTLRYAAERGALLPAATHLSAEAAERVARSLGRFDRDASTHGRGIHAQVARIFDLPADEAAALALDRCAAPYRDLVAVQRLAAGREEDADLDAQLGAVPPALRAHMKQGRPFVLAMGHFYDSTALRIVEAAMRFSELGGRPDGPVAVANVVVPRLRFPHPWLERLRLRDAAVARALRRLSGGHEGVRFADLNGGSGLLAGPRQLRRVLGETGGVAVVQIDAPWERPGAYRRPFAGFAERGFSMGAVRLARRVGCPVVLVLPDGPPDALRVRWSEPLQPGVDHTDAEVLELMLNDLERSVASHAAEYQFDLGWDRRWDAALGRWETIPAPPADEPARGAPAVAPPALVPEG